MQAAEKTKPVILFDGYCHLCSGVVRFILRRDPKCRFRFVALQSESGQALLKAHGVPSGIGDSIVLLGERGWSVESMAALRILRRLRWPWPLFSGLILVPCPVRDAVYRFIARNRYRWFGKSNACMVPRVEWRERFL